MDRKPPTRKLRANRRISMIIPASFVGWINEDLAQGWTVTELISAALQHIYPDAGKTLPPAKGRNKPKET